MFERFESNAKEVITKAQQEAKLLGSNSIRLEHILLGFLNEPEKDDIAGTTLLEFELTLSDVRNFIKKNTPGGEVPATTGKLPFSTDCKKILELALRETLSLGAQIIGTEHLLLGMIRDEVLVKTKDSESMLVKICTKFDVNTEKLRTAILKKITQQTKGGQKVGAGQKSSGEHRQGHPAFLDQYANNLTESAREGKLDPVVGRDVEIRRVMQILTRRTKNNPVLVGYAGVGKTSIVEGLAQRIVDGNVPGRLENKEIYLEGLQSRAKKNKQVATLLKNKSKKG